MTSHFEFYPPRQKQIEQAVLGSMMIDADALKRGLELLKAYYFVTPHAVIYDAMEQLYSKGEQVNQLTVGEELKSNGAMERVGGHEYLAELACAVATGSDIDLHCKAVMEAAVGGASKDRFTYAFQDFPPSYCASIVFMYNWSLSDLIDRLEDIGVTPMGPVEMATNTGPPNTSIPVMIEALCEILVHEATIRPGTFPSADLDNLAGAILTIRKLLHKKGD